MRKHLMLLLTLSAVLTYRPGHAQARTDGSGDSSPALVASTHVKPVSTRTSTESTPTKASGTATKKETKTTAKVAQKPISRFWSRIMGICSEVHTAAKKKS